MSATNPLCCLLKINPDKLSREENFIVETELFYRTYRELEKIYATECRSFFRLTNFTKEMEQEMLDSKFIYFLIRDILSTNEYSVEGISHYTQMPEDAIHDLLSAKNTNPSLVLSRKIIELHHSVRPDLYATIMKKITNQYLTGEMAHI